MKLAPRPWIGCGPGWPPVRIGDSAGSTANTLRLRPDRLEHFGAGGDVAAGADAGDDRVERLVGEVAQDFLRGRAAVDLDIGGVVELLRHPAVRRLVDQLLRRGRPRPDMPFSLAVRSNVAP